MKYTIPKNVTKTLRVLLLIAFVCDLLMLPLVPALVLLNGMEPLEALAVSGMPDAPIWLLAIFLMAWITVWSYGGHAVMLTLFLLFSGVCAAVILWQGRRVLRTLLRGRPFSAENAASLNRAAVCAFLIAAAALVRVVVSVRLYRSVRPLLNYNALFIAVFSIAGLLCLVMAALFRQAAELKAENDLII